MPSHYAMSVIKSLAIACVFGSILGFILAGVSAGQIQRGQWIYGTAYSRMPGILDPNPTFAVVNSHFPDNTTAEFYASEDHTQAGMYFFPLENMKIGNGFVTLLKIDLSDMYVWLNAYQGSYQSWDMTNYTEYITGIYLYIGWHINTTVQGDYDFTLTIDQFSANWDSSVTYTDIMADPEFILQRMIEEDHWVTVDTATNCIMDGDIDIYTNEFPMDVVSLDDSPYVAFMVNATALNGDELPHVLGLYGYSIEDGEYYSDLDLINVEIDTSYYPAPFIPLNTALLVGTGFLIGAFLLGGYVYWYNANYDEHGCYLETQYWSDRRKHCMNKIDVHGCDRRYESWHPEKKQCVKGGL